MKTASILAILALLWAALPACAQFTLTQGSFPATGGHDLGQVYGASFSVGSPGASQTWTFSDYEWELIAHEELVSVAGTPYAGTFPTSNRCVHLTGGDTPEGGFYFYYRMAADGLYLLGYGSIEMVMATSDVAQYVALPCTYQTQWTTVLRYSLGGMTITDSTLNTVDGWGTLVTPYASNAVLRIFGHTWNSQVYPPPLPPMVTETVHYNWLSSQGEQLLRVMSGPDVTDPNFSTGFLEMAGVPEAAEPVRGPVAQKFRVSQNYPNPFNPVTTLPVELEKTARLTLTVYDETGRLVSRQEFDLSAGHHNLTVNGNDWAAGTYFARVMSAEQAQTVKMQLVK
jgi:hypothetical protein